MNFSEASGVAPLVAHTFSAPVNSDVSPKQRWTPNGSNLSIKLPTAGLAAIPDVVSDSPHLTEIHKSLKGHSSLCFSEAHCENSWAFLEAFIIVWISPAPSILKPSTGFPVVAIASTIFFVHFGSIPITTQAATFGFFPVPIIVSKNNSRSAPNWSLPYACGIAKVPFILFATASAQAFEISSTGSITTWFLVPTLLFSLL